MSKQSRPTVLLTRPLPQSQRFAAELATQIAGVAVQISPLFQPRFLPCAAPDPGPVIFTSETAVAAAAPYFHAGQTAFCVGPRTAHAAKLAGYDARNAQGDWRDLAQVVQRDAPRAKLTFFCAKNAPTHLETALSAAGYDVLRCDVYVQDALTLSASARALLGFESPQDIPVILPLFSPRSAQVLSSQLQAARAPLWLAAISPAALQAFASTAARQETALAPNAAEMIAAIKVLLQ